MAADRVDGRLALLLLMVSLSLVFGCADPPESGRRGSEALGAIAFSINWGQSAAARFTCGAGGDGVAFVDARLVNDHHTNTLAEPWPCAAGRGTMSQVPVGSDYTLTISAYDAEGQARYCLEQAGITVQPGLNDLGALNAYPFETRATAPANNALDVDVDSPRFRWEALAGAAGYRLIVSPSADLSAALYDDTVDGLTITLAANLLQPDTRYWWAVAPVDFDGRPGPMDGGGIFSFTTRPVDVPVDTCPNDDYGDTTEAAVDILPERALEGGIDCSGDRDFFRLTLPSDMAVSLYTVGALDSVGTLLDGDGLEITVADDITLSNQNFLIQRYLAAGTYFVVVAGYDLDELGAYTLVVDDDHADILSAATSTGIENQAVPGVLEPSNDRDYFRLVWTAEAYVYIYTNGSTDTYGRLLDSTGMELAADDDTGPDLNFQIDGTLAPGTYFIEVTLFGDGTPGGDYTLTWTTY